MKIIEKLKTAVKKFNDWTNRSPYHDLVYTTAHTTINSVSATLIVLSVLGGSSALFLFIAAFCYFFSYVGIKKILKVLDTVEENLNESE